MKLPIRIRVALYVTSTFGIVIVALSLVLMQLYERYSYRSFEPRRAALQTGSSKKICRLMFLTSTKTSEKLFQISRIELVS